MRKWVTTLFVAAFALSFACISAAPVSAAPGALDFMKIQSSFKDWDGSYNEMLTSWTFQKYTASAEGEDQISTFYIDKLSASDAGSYNDYVKNLKKKDWLDLTYVWTEISSNEKLPDGFVFLGKSVAYKEKGAKPLLSFVVVRQFKNTSIRCKGDAADAALLAEAVSFCKGLK